MRSISSGNNKIKGIRSAACPNPEVPRQRGEGCSPRRPVVHVPSAKPALFDLKPSSSLFENFLRSSSRTLRLLQGFVGREVNRQHHEPSLGTGCQGQLPILGSVLRGLQTIHRNRGIEWRPRQAWAGTPLKGPGWGPRCQDGKCQQGSLEKGVG